ncbi:MAG TPA: GNAT family N-acetyltransferase [Burkholderiales bacterium]
MERNWLHERLRAITPLRLAVRRVRGTIAPYRLRDWSLRGAERSSGAPLALGLCGQLGSKQYFAHLAFGRVEQERERRRRWIQEVLLPAARTPAPFDVLALDVPRFLYERYRGPVHSQPEAGLFCIPSWVRGEIELPGAAAAARLPETLRTDLKLVERNGFGWRITREPALFDWFYEHMYLPYLLRTHGPRALPTTRQEMLEQQPRAELMLIHRNGVDVAGLMLIRHPTHAHAWALGVLDGEHAHVKAGALAAVYRFACQYSWSLGYRTIDMGMSRPFLNDGVLQYKKKWGLRLTTPNERLYVLRFEPRSEAARAFLQRNPFLYERDGGLHGAVFLAPSEADDPQARARLHKKCFFPGIATLDFFLLTPDGIHRLESCAAPPEAART